MKESITESAKEHIPTIKRKEDKRWMNTEILQLMEERRKAKANEQKYKELDRQVKKRCNEAKENWINAQCQEIEANANIDSKTMHQKIRDVTGRKTPTTTGCLRSKDGNILMEKEDILNRWSEYITELYHDDRGPPPIISNEAISKMKKGKAAGPEDIPIELIQAMSDTGIKVVTHLLNEIHATECIQQIWKSLYT